MRKRANTINLFTTLLVVVWVFACVTLKAANKNFVVVSYDVSLSMAGYSGKDQINRWITVEAHDRIKSYLNVLLNNGWNNQQLLSSDDSIVVNLQPDSILNKTALIGNDSGWAILHFAENVKVVDERLFDQPWKNFGINYPTNYPYQNTAFNLLFDKIAYYAKYAAKNNANLYWINVTDNVEDTRGMGGGTDSEAFEKFCSEYGYSPVFSVKLSVSGKNNQKKTDTQAYIKVSRVVESNYVRSDLSKQIAELEKEYNDLKSKYTLPTSYIEYEIDSIKKRNARAKSPEDISEVEQSISEIRNKIDDLEKNVKLTASLAKDIDVLRKNLNAYKAKYGSSNEIVKNIEQDIDKLDLNKFKISVDEFGKEVAKLSGIMANLDSELAIAERNRAERKTNEKYDKILNDLKNKINRAKELYGNNVNELVSLDEKFETLNKDLPNLSVKETDKAIDDLDKELGHLVISLEKRTEAKRKVSPLIDKLNKIKSFYNPNSAQIKAVENKISELESNYSNKSDEEVATIIETLDKEIDALPNILNEEKQTKNVGVESDRKKIESYFKELKSKYSGLAERNKKIDAVTNELKSIGEKISKLESNLPNDLSDQLWNTEAERCKAEIDKTEQALFKAENPELYAKLEKIEEDIKTIKTVNPTVKQKDIDLVNSELEQCRANFGKNVDETSNAIRMLEGKVSRLRNESSGFGTFLFFIIIIGIAVGVIAVIKNAKKGFSIYIEREDGDGWSNRREYYISPNDGQNLISLSDSSDGDGYSYQYGATDYVIKCQSFGSLVLKSGSSEIPINFDSPFSIPNANGDKLRIIRVDEGQSHSHSFENSSGNGMSNDGDSSDDLL